MSKISATKIDQIAAVWAAKADRGLSDDEARALTVWLDSDDRALGAYGRLRAVSLHSEKLRALRPDMVRRTDAPRNLTKRHLLWLGGGVAAASVAASGYVALEYLGTAYRTRRGEIRNVALSDGSMITLNTATTVEVAMLPRRRLVRLLEGEALFAVASDRARPFIVDAGEAHVRALGTQFSVQRLPQAPVRIWVREGVVDVTARPTSGPEHSARAQSNTQVLVDDSTNPLRTVSVDLKTIDLGLSWKEGRIAFQGEPLKDAVKEFSRYSDTRIVIDDPDLAETPVVGLYQANDPVSFARTIATILNLQISISGGEIHLERVSGT
jgi:transmembrane sensor